VNDLRQWRHRQRATTMETKITMPASMYRRPRLRSSCGANGSFPPQAAQTVR
jgi:hypothetical protein